MAFTGQTEMQTPHLAQILGSTFAIPLTIAIAPIGHARTHIPHPMHESSTCGYGKDGVCEELGTETVLAVSFSSVDLGD